MHPLRGAKLTVGYIVSFLLGNVVNIVMLAAAGIFAFSHEGQHFIAEISEKYFIPVAIYWEMYATGLWAARDFWFSSRILKLAAILSVGLLWVYILLGLGAQALELENPWAFAAFFTATDPIGVGIALSLLPPSLIYIRKMTVQLGQESGWNDGIAIVLLAIATGTGTFMMNAQTGIKGFAISVLIGLALAALHMLLRDWLRRSERFGVYTEVIVITISLIIASEIAKSLGSTPILTTVIGAGVGNILDALRVKNLDPAEEHQAHEMWELLSQVANFVILGILGFIIPWAYMFADTTVLMAGGLVILTFAAARSSYVFGKRFLWALYKRDGFGHQYKDILVPTLNAIGGIPHLGVPGLIGISWLAAHGHTFEAAVAASAVMWSLLGIPPSVVFAIIAEKHGAEKYEHSWEIPGWLLRHVQKLPDDVRPPL